jgi:DNA polymerase-3 subunit epsilon
VTVQLAFTTADELFALLEREGQALDYRDVWPRLFPVRNCSPELMRALVDDVVTADERFSWESDVHVGLACWKATHRDLAAVAFTVVDLETTGSTPGYAKITEIGAVRLEGGVPVDTFSQLVNPGLPIPSFITSITGISQQMVSEAPPIEEVLPRFVEFAAGTVLVAHNARFDLGFLDYELGILQRRTFQRPALDTMRLARRLMPHSRASLSYLAERFGTQVRPSHRALRDAQATAEIFAILLAMVQEQGITTLEAVARFCEPSARRNYHKIVLTEELPQSPGVYIMRDDRGQPLYIGKAECLRRRTRDHFLQKQAYGARQALELLHHIDVIETGSEFEALLLEARLIAQHKPPYNEHGTRTLSYYYVKLTNEEYPRLYATPNRLDDGAFYAGPFRKASLARRVVDCLTASFKLRTCVRLAQAGAPVRPARTAHPHGTSRPPTGRACQRLELGLCLGPCTGMLNGEYPRAVQKVREVLGGERRALDEELERRQASLAAALQFEQAARVQEEREALASATRTVRRLNQAAATWAALVYPAREEGRINLWGIAGGSIVTRQTVDPQQFALQDALLVIRRICEAEPPKAPLPASAIDVTLLIESWIRQHRAAPNILLLQTPQPKSPGAPRLSDQATEGAAQDLLARIALCRVS